MDIHNPTAWIEAFLENVPEENRESFGQVQALREYSDCISHLPEPEQEKLWTAFQSALDERFPSRKLAVSHSTEKGEPLLEKTSDEEIVGRAVHEFSAPGDESPEFHELLFQRAMGIVEQELREEKGVSRWFRRRRIAGQIRRWMKENLV